ALAAAAAAQRPLDHDTARDLVRRLGGTWHGSYGMACCPCHEDRRPSLKVRDDPSRSGGIDLHCFAGCDWRSIKDALAGGARQNTGRSPVTIPGRPDPDYRASALHIWRAARPVEGTAAEAYLRHRGIAGFLPPCLRFHPGLRHTPSGRVLPALVAAIEDGDG